MGVPTTEFTIEKTSIEGLLIIHITQIADERGWFQEKFQQQKLVAAGFPADFLPVQTNISFNKEAGVVRGFHAEPWDKYISIVSGRAFGAYIDLRTGPGFGTIVTVEIDDKTAVFLPRGCGNSFQTLEPNTYYSYFVNDFWSRDAKYAAVSMTDPAIKVDWPIALDQSIMSERDKTLPLLAELNQREQA